MNEPLSSKPESIKPPYDVALPKITAEVWESYQDEEFIEDFPRWNWTQAAVDFACEIVRPAVWAEIERLTAELADARRPHWRDELNAANAVIDRLRAALVLARNFLPSRDGLPRIDTEIRRTLDAVENALAGAADHKDAVA